MQVILDSSFARPGLAPIWGGKKGEFRDWTSNDRNVELPIFAFLARKPLIIIRDKDKVSKQYSAVHFHLKIVMTCLPSHLYQSNPQIRIFENIIPIERSKTKHKTPSTHCGPIFDLYWVYY